MSAGTTSADRSAACSALEVARSADVGVVAFELFFPPLSALGELSAQFAEPPRAHGHGALESIGVMGAAASAAAARAVTTSSPTSSVSSGHARQFSRIAFTFRSRATVEGGWRGYRAGRHLGTFWNEQSAS